MTTKRTQLPAGSSCEALGAGLAMLLLLNLVGCSKGTAAPAAPPPVVEVADVVQQDTPIYSEWIAILDGYVNAQIQPHVSGYIIRQNYKEGSVVKEGDVLFEIDPRPFKAVSSKRRGSSRKPKHSWEKPRSTSSAIRRWRRSRPSPEASSTRKSRRSSLRRQWSKPQKRTWSRPSSTSSGPR